MEKYYSEKTMEAAVNKKKVVLFICMAVMLELLLCLFVFPAQKPAEPVTLNVALYSYIPDYSSFEDTVRKSWEEAHPEVKLQFVQWDCYEPVIPDDLDVFVFDAVNLDVFADSGRLLPLSEEDIDEFDDLIPAFVEGCRVDGTICAVPQLLCADFLFTRKSDAELREIKSIDGLYHALGDSGLVTDYRSDRTKVILYLQALIDEAQAYMDSYPKVEEGTLSERAVKSLAQIRDLRDTDPEGVVDKNNRYYYARRFSEGMGRAYIGYLESLDVMGENASEMDFRPFSMTDAENIPVFYVDVASISSTISDDKKALALELLNLITGRKLLSKASVQNGDLKYLLCARSSVYDDVMDSYPIYKKLKDIATVPVAYVFRVKPGGDTFLQEAKKNAGLLPGLYK